MSLIWGVTWLATKVAIVSIPPVFFGAARYVLVSAVLLIAVRGVFRVLTGPLAGRVIISALLVNVGTYALLYWGMQFVASGVAGVVNMSMNPVFLFGFAILLGQERASWRHLAALVLGIAGLVILFSGKTSFTGSEIELWAAAAFVAALGLSVLSLALEPVSAATFAAVLQPLPLAGLLFMVLFGTFVAYTIFLRLVRDWGAPR